MTPNTIEFRITHNEAPKWVMKITADRRLEVNEDVDVTEAAKQVLEAMQWMLDKQKRTWVGLTDEEIEQGCKESWVTEQAFQSAVWWAESKLKEKNT
jgi:hypothetical protein